MESGGKESIPTPNEHKLDFHLVPGSDMYIRYAAGDPRTTKLFTIVKLELGAEGPCDVEGEILDFDNSPHILTGSLGGKYEAMVNISQGAGATLSLSATEYVQV